MGRFSLLVGKRVEAHYRAGDIHLFAVGFLVNDSGKSVFLEDRFVQGGKEKMMRIEIPYQSLVRIDERPREAGSTSLETPPALKPRF